MIKPGLRLFSSHVYHRLDAYLIEVWQEVPCSECNVPLSTDHLILTERDDQMLSVAGVHEAICPRPPAATTAFGGSFLCEPCTAAWLNPATFRSSIHG